MDCCNYMQYRSHQPYGFSPGYYDHLSDYNHGGDFYGQHLYHDYYNSHYYPQQWSQVSPFTDYVYNPKEARIRKAMREASRDRSVGASPMLPRPGARLSPHTDWAQPQENQLMMCSMDSMRRMDPPMCNYPITNSENEQYLPPMNGYNKIESPSMMPTYMQPSPLAQLQQQTEMWHPYQDNLRPRPLGTPFHHTMIPDIQPPTYHSQEPVQDSATNLVVEKSRHSPVCAPPSIAGTASPVHRVPDENALTPPAGVTDPTNGQQELRQHLQPNPPPFLESKLSPESLQATMVDNNQQHENQFIPIPELSCNTFEPPAKIEPPVTVTKKPRGRPPTKKPIPPPPPPKPLPDFNEAFGSTERGRFLSPPDPRLNKSYLDALFESDPSL